MSEEDITLHEGGISTKYRRKELFKTWIVLLIKDIAIIIIISLIILINSIIAENSNIPSDVQEAIRSRARIITYAPMIFFIGCIIVDVVILLLNFVFLTMYINNFSYLLTKSSIIIDHGILEKNHVTIPYNRIQNINIKQGVFDRKFNTYTFSIQTAGGGGKVTRVFTNAGFITVGAKPEGYIPGVVNPEELKGIIRQNMEYFSQVPSGVEDKILKPKEVAFDNFISLIMQRVEDAEKLNFKLSEMMKKKQTSAEELSKMSKVSLQTINSMISGEYAPSVGLAKKIAIILNCRIDEIFQSKQD